MDAIIDFYTELNINRNLNIDEINLELSKLEGTWRQREIMQPEKATNMLSLIFAARKVFASEPARKEYDVKLEQAMHKQDDAEPSNDKTEVISRLCEEAQEYIESGQIDLAEAVVEKALSLLDPGVSDARLFGMTALVYSEIEGKNKKSLYFINRAILEEPNNAIYYVAKASINYKLMEKASQNNDSKEIELYRDEFRKNAQIASEKAEKSSDLNSMAYAYGMLAESYYFVGPKDLKLGEEYAKKSMELGGDLWEYAESVLTSVNLFNTWEEIYSDAMKRAQSNDISELKSVMTDLRKIMGYKDSFDQVQLLEEKVRRLEEEKNESENMKHMLKTLGLFFLLLILFLVFSMIFIAFNDGHIYFYNGRFHFS